MINYRLSYKYLCISALFALSYLAVCCSEVLYDKVSQVGSFLIICWISWQIGAILFRKILATTLKAVDPAKKCVLVTGKTVYLLFFSCLQPQNALLDCRL